MRGEAGDAGDYVYAAATRTYGAAVWNDVRDAADCPAIDTYRQDLHDEAVATGVQTAEAEEPRGADEGKEPDQEEPAEAPDVQLVWRTSATPTSSEAVTPTRRLRTRAASVSTEP